MWAFDNIENKHSLYCGEDFMKKFYISLREHTKEESVTVNGRSKITSRFNRMSHLQKIIPHKSLLQIKTIVKLETIAILLANIEVRQTVCVI